MIGLRISFDLGRYHATPWGSNVNDATVEWPPSPWRLLRGLYAVGRTHAQLTERRDDLDRALSTLASAQPPLYELPAALPAHTRHYMPVPDGRREKSAKVLDGFLALDRGATVAAWWDVNLDAKASDALSTAARCLGYVGRSESVCTARLVTGAGPEDPAASPVGTGIDVESPSETIDLLCVDTNAPLSTLKVGVAELRTQRRQVPPGTRWVTYRLAERDRPEARHPDVESTRLAKPQLALYRVRGSDRPSLAEAVKMGQLLRSSLQSRFGKLTRGATSPTLSGRAGDRHRADQHRHAHYISLPDRHGRRIDKLAIWAPEGLGGNEVTALAALHVLHDPMVEKGKYQVALGALGEVGELELPRLLGPAREWTSLTPFALVRHPKKRRGVVVDSAQEQIVRELAHRGLPEPEDIELRKGQWHRFRSSKLGETRLDRKPLVGLRIRFPGEVTGPIAIGALSHFGLGLMVPSHLA